MKSRYAVKLIFQFRVENNGQSNVMRDVEERIVLVHAENASAALKQANGIGKADQSNFINNDGNKVYIEYIGVLDMMHLGIECLKSTVWYEIKKMLTPLERKNKLIPKTCNLSAFKYERKKKDKK